MGTKKPLSWLASLLIHGVGLVMILVAGFHIVTPEGSVTDKIEFEAVGNITPPLPPPPAPPVSQPTTESQPAQPVAAAPQEVAKPAEPTKTEEAPQQEPVADEAPSMEPPPPITQQDDSAPPIAHETAAEDPASEPENNQATNPASTAEPSATPTQAASETASASPIPEATATTVAAMPTDAQTDPQSVPQYGTPGSTIDESKLTEAFGNHKPSYPWMARLRKQQGTVILRAFINKDGVVSQAVIEQSSGSSLIDQEALKSYTRWKYQPGLSGWVLKPFNFSLK